MAAPAAAPAIQPTTIPGAIDVLEAQIAHIRVKNQTMIGLYIYPNPTPSAIAAYGPRIDILEKRIKQIDSISLSNLTLLLNDASSAIAAYLLEITSQLAAAVYGFQNIFIHHYDPTIADGLPYLSIFQTLKYLEEQLKYFIKFHRDNNPHRRPADQLHPPSPSLLQPTYCRNAISFINNQDWGRITPCLPADLTDDNRRHLRSQGGTYVWWECPSCAFRLRFHVTNSVTMNINQTDEIRTHPSPSNLEYRSAWLAKSHLYHFGREEQNLERERRRLSSLTSPTSPRFSSSRIAPLNTYGVANTKYGCPLCFAQGVNLDAKRNCFPTAAAFAAHISEKHGGKDTKDLPGLLLLETLKVGVGGEMARGVNRWDLNFT